MRAFALILALCCSFVVNSTVAQVLPDILNAPQTATFPIAVSANGRFLQTAGGQPWLLMADSAQALVDNVPLCSGSGVIVGGYTCSGTDPGWSSTNNVTNYVSTRAADGFTAIQVDLVCDNYVDCQTGTGTGGPDVAGNEPFTSGNSPANYVIGASPCANCNSAYWNRIDAIVRLIGSYGMAAMLNPTPTEGCQSGTFMDMFANTTANTAAFVTGYGTFLGNRYKGFSNVLWQGGNDYGCNTGTSPTTGVTYDSRVSSVQYAITTAGDTHLQTLELGAGCNANNVGPYSAYENVAANPSNHWSTILAINSSYMYYCPSTITVDGGIPFAYAEATLPTISVEQVYELENNGGSDGATNGLCGTPYTTLPPSPAACANQNLRKQEWGMFTTGGVGEIFGHHCIWAFYVATQGEPGCPSDWSAYLNTVGSQQFIYAKNFLSNYAWQKLAPDTGNTFLTGGAGTACNASTLLSSCTYATAAVASDGSLAIVYVPAAQTSITLQLSQLATGNAVAVWYDPTTASTTSSTGSGITNPCPASSPCAVTHGTSNSKSFGNTNVNSEGNATWSHDWVLALTAH